MKRYIKSSSSFSGRVSAKQIADELYLLGRMPANGDSAYSEYSDKLENAVDRCELTLESTEGKLIVFDNGQYGVIALGATEDRGVGVIRRYEGHGTKRFRYTVCFQNVPVYSWSTSVKETALQWAREYLSGNVDDQLHYFD